MKTLTRERGNGADTGWQILDVLDVHVAVLDRAGVIVHTNRAWDSFAAKNPLADGSDPLHTGVGTNYLNICRTAVGSSMENSYAAYQGIKDVLAGKKRQFVLEYPCHSPNQQRWFVMKVFPLKESRPRQVVVVHTNVTAVKQAEFKTHRKTLELTQALEQMESFAGQLKGVLALEETARSFPGHAVPANHKVVRKSSGGGSEHLKLLSGREREVLLALVRGERNTDIAERLSLSTKSVSTYRSRVMEKLQAKTMADLVLYMTRVGAL